MKEKYEIIVIGAGLGGLTAAALLAKRGLDVLVIEQHFLPGGACTSFRKQDRIFDCGAATIFGFGKEGFNPLRFVINEIEEEIEVIPRNIFHRMWFLGEKILFWKDMDKYLNEISRLFPDQEDELRSFYAYMRQFYKKFIQNQDMLTPASDMSLSQKMKMFFQRPLGTLKIASLLTKSAGDIQKPYLKSQKLKEFFDMLYAGYSYTSTDETPALMALTMLTDNHTGGPGYIAGGAQVYSNKLEHAIEKYRGTMLYRHKVENILMDNKHRAYGVKLDDGTEILADRIISNAMVYNLYEQLIDSSHIKKPQLNWVNKLENTYPAIVMYAAVKKEIFPPEIHPVEYFISDSSQIDAGDIMLYIPGLEDDSLGPSDEYVITIFSPAPNQQWPSPNDPEYQSREYQQKKKNIADQIISEIEIRFPGFQEGITMLYISTPSTVERYTLKRGGCVGGPKQSIGQELMKRLHAKTDWKNLYAVGDSTTMGMGVPAVTTSGIGATNVILRELGKKEFVLHPFDKQYVTFINHKASLPKVIKFDESEESAKLLARECQHCETRPCKTCPADIDIPNFMRRIEEGNFLGAYTQIRHMNPFMEICGYLCPAEKYCQKSCYRNSFSDKSVRIKELHRWLGERYNSMTHTPINPPNGRSIAIIGAGVDGLSCAYFFAQLGYKIAVYEKNAELGGHLSNLIQEDKIPKEVVERELSSILFSTIKIQTNKSISFEDIIKLSQQYDAVYVSPHDLRNNFSLTFDLKQYPNLFTSSDAISPELKSEISPLVFQSRLNVQKIHTHLNSR
ncbi:MAG: NAD(P)-binding protein [Candidatus Lokiarchaeota archaeon]|nr:NAD(P)-binding protein [Candidatus Lokiarchaeota archaeon]